jgi:hypothetical protein
MHTQAEAAASAGAVQQAEAAEAALTAAKRVSSCTASQCGPPEDAVLRRCSTDGHLLPLLHITSPDVGDPYICPKSDAKL